MRYILLIYGNEAAAATASAAEQQAEFTAYMTYTEELRAAGIMTGGDPLLPTSAATTVRIRNDKTLTTHGPFAETTEQLLGFYIINCENLDEALVWAAKNPGSKTGSIEVRPIVEM